MRRFQSFENDEQDCLRHDTDLDLCISSRAAQSEQPKHQFARKVGFLRRALDTFKFSRHAMRATSLVRPKCSHGCVSLKESPLKPVRILKRDTRTSTEQTSMRTKWFKHIAMQTIQEHLLVSAKFRSTPKSVQVYFLALFSGLAEIPLSVQILMFLLLGLCGLTIYTAVLLRKYWGLGSPESS